MKKRNWKRVVAAIGVAAMLGTEFGSDYTAIRTRAESAEDVTAVEDQEETAEPEEPAASAVETSDNQNLTGGVT